MEEKFFNRCHFAEFLVYLSDSHTEARVVGEAVMTVRFFLSNVECVTRKEYVRFMKEHASDFTRRTFRKDLLLEYLNFVGVGFGRKMKRKTSNLNVEQKISDKNKELVNGFAKYLQDENDYSAVTIKMYVGHVTKFYNYFERFSQDSCKSYLRMQEEAGRSPKTLNHYISSFLRFGAYAKYNIHLKPYKVQSAGIVENIPTAAEYKRLLASLLDKEDVRPYWIVRLLGTTGVRVSELLQIRWEHVLAGEVSLKCKGNKFRIIRFSRSVQEDARSVVLKYGLSGYVCVSRYGSQYTVRGLRAGLQSWGKKVDIPLCKLHPHAFRHFFAKQYLNRDKNLVHLADILGHSKIDTTRVYLMRSNVEQQKDFNRYVDW